MGTITTVHSSRIERRQTNKGHQHHDLAPALLMLCEKATLTEPTTASINQNNGCPALRRPPSRLRVHSLIGCELDRAYRRRALAWKKRTRQQSVFVVLLEEHIEDNELQQEKIEVVEVI